MDGVARPMTPSSSDEITKQQTSGQDGIEISCWYASRQAAVSSVLICLVIGLAYIVAQSIINKAIRDAFFVGMLLGATVFLFSGLRAVYRYILRKGVGFFAFLATKPDQRAEVAKYPDLISSVFNFKRMTWAGLLYGLVLALSPFVLGAWPESYVLRIFLAVFLLAVNFATGVGFYGLITFFIKSLKLGRLVQVDIWQKENPSTEFLLGAARRIALVASTYICICNASFLFSVLPLSGFVLGYALFSGSLIVSSSLVPALPIVQKISVSKRDALHHINTQIQQEFGRILDASAREDNQLDLARLDKLIALRDRIDGTTVWPLRVKFLSTGLSIIVVTLLPPLLQAFIQKYLK
jgi:hypothetical protein